MSSKRLQCRVPSANFVTIATLNNHDLRFHKISTDGSGKCDAFETGNRKHTVIGVVYEISAAEKPMLDQKEGLGYGYNEKVVSVEMNSGEIIEAVTYYAIKIDPVLNPYQWYKQHVLRGATEHGLAATYVDCIDKVAAFDDPNPERHEEELSIYGIYRFSS